MGKIILASSSPRRQSLLKKLNLKFEIVPSPYEEDRTRTDFSYEFIESLALNKALAVVPFVKEQSLIIGADTMVVLEGKILGKPTDTQDAFNMLKSLSGKTHSVVTGIAIINSETQEIKQTSVTSIVKFEKLSDKQILNYINKFNPLDKAGSYGIQEMPQGYIKSYSGSFENIVGLDTKTVDVLLKSFDK